MEYLTDLVPKAGFRDKGLVPTWSGNRMASPVPTHSPIWDVTGSTIFALSVCTVSTTLEVASLSPLET